MTDPKHEYFLDRLDDWHNDPRYCTIHDYLNVSKEDYLLWVGLKITDTELFRRKTSNNFHYGKKTCAICLDPCTGRFKRYFDELLGDVETDEILIPGGRQAVHPECFKEMIEATNG